MDKHDGKPVLRNEHVPAPVSATLPVEATPWSRFRPSPFLPFYRDRIDERSSFAAYSGHLSPNYLGEDVAADYWHLRQNALLFDVPEHAIELSGPDVAPFLDMLMTRQVSAMSVGRCGYGIMCDHDGGILMDGVLIRLGQERFRYVLADGEVFTWLKAHRPGYDVQVHDTSDWVLQVQGPSSLRILAEASDGGIPEPFAYFSAARVTIDGEPLLVSRTGWTGEMGFELYIPESCDHERLWHNLLRIGAPHGLRFASMAAMNLRRIEAGILDNGSDMDPSMTPFAANLGRFVDLSKPAFIGREALLEADRRPRLVGLRCERALDAGLRLHVGGRPVGRTTAGSWSPYLRSGVAYARFDGPGDWLHIDVQIGTNGQTGTTTPLPFYDPKKRIARGLDGAISG